jgi:hypothetical protein
MTEGQSQVRVRVAGVVGIPLDLRVKVFKVKVKFECMVAGVVGGFPPTLLRLVV